MKRIISGMIVLSILISCFIIQTTEAFAAALPGPVVVNPVSGADYDKADMILSWNSVSGAQNYTLAVRDLTTNTLIVTSTTTTALSYTIGSELFTAGHQYKFAVGANSSDASTGWTEVIFAISNITETSDGYEPNDSITSAYGIGNNTTINPSIHNSSDIDFFKLSIPYLSDIVVTLTPPSDKDYDLELQDSSGAKIAESRSGTGLVDSVSKTSLTAGTYYVKVYGYLGAYSTSAYTLQISTVSGERVGNSITLSAQEGSASGDVNTSISSVTRHNINNSIPGDRMVVVSLSGVANGNSFTAKLYSSETGQEVASYSGGWYGLTKMKYYKTTAFSNTSYYVLVSSTTSGTYTVNLAVLNISSFSNLDTKENISTNRTYCISNSPENLNSNYYKGEYGYYLQRSVVQGNANIYYEHSNTIGYGMKFGVLLYNTSGSSVTVNINRRSFKTRSQSSTAMMDVWVDWFNKTIKPDQSGVTSSVSIPSNQGKWICLHDVENGSNMPWGLLNGVVDISIPTGISLYCDTYYITSGTSTNGLTYVENTRRNVANAKKAVCTDNLRGSGEGAILSSNIIGTTVVSPSDPYKLAITGFDPPNLNPGELKPIYDYLGNKVQDNCNNYSVVYKLNFNNFSSTGTIKGQVRYNPKVSPNYLDASDGGIYVIVQKKVGSTLYAPYKVLLTNSVNTGTFDSNVPQGISVTYYVVASGMSSLPLEVGFVN